MEIKKNDRQEVVEDKQEQTKEGEIKELTLTQEELEKKLQSEADRRVTEALKTAKSKWQEEYDAKLEKERKEAERLATLSAEEKEQEILKQKEEEIAQREQALRRKELQLDAIQILEEEKLPIKFVDMLLGQDAESTQANIKSFKKEWQRAIEEEMKERVSVGTYRRTPSSSNGGLTLGEKLAQKTKTQKVEHKFW